MSTFVPLTPMNRRPTGGALHRPVHAVRTSTHYPLAVKSGPFQLPAQHGRTAERNRGADVCPLHKLASASRTLPGDIDRDSRLVLSTSDELSAAAARWIAILRGMTTHLCRRTRGSHS